jgi:hypothetical protein
MKEIQFNPNHWVVQLVYLTWWPFCKQVPTQTNLCRMFWRFAFFLPSIGFLLLIFLLAEGVMWVARKVNSVLDWIEFRYLIQSRARMFKPTRPPLLSMPSPTPLVNLVDRLIAAKKNKLCPIIRFNEDCQNSKDN